MTSRLESDRVSGGYELGSPKGRWDRFLHGFPGAGAVLARRDEGSSRAPAEGWSTFRLDPDGETDITPCF
jgi:hypothetical protein